MRGFSLIEMAVVSFILLLLLGGLLVPIATQVEQRRIARTQQTLEEIKEALMGFAVSHGRLPCPDLRVPMSGYSSNDGQEDIRPTGECAQQDGNLPWATLGVAKTDAWGRLFRYAVSPQFSSTTTPIQLGSATTLTVFSRDATGAPQRLTNLNGIPAVILSQGKNGYGGINGDGTPTAPVPSPNLDEASNAKPYTTMFYARTIKSPQLPCNDNGAPLCEFDDIVDWLSPNVLFSRMVAAQRLP